MNGSGRRKFGEEKGDWKGSEGGREFKEEEEEVEFVGGAGNGEGR